MKVLWLCNVGYNEIYKKIGIKGVPYGGWIEGALAGVEQVDDIEIAVCFPAAIEKDYLYGENKGVVFFAFKAANTSPEIYCDKYEEYFKYVLDKFRPDIVHIWGTEYAHTLAMVRVFNRSESTIISIQGMCSVYANHYYAFLPRNIEKYTSLRDIIRNDTLKKQLKKYISRGENEIAALKKVDHVIGRTEWDAACVSQVNGSVKYHFCGESLRDSFYKNQWQLEKCEKHTIFASQADYPIKGFHILLEAASIIIKKYPDLKIYTTSRDPRKLKFYQITTYEKYILHLLNMYELNNSVAFLGRLNEEEMCNRYLLANVFVSASSIENSPNSVGEAMVLGVPTVSSDVGGVKDFIVHKMNGYIYPADEPYMLANYVMNIFASDELAINVSEEAKKNIRYYDRDYNTQELVNIYKTMRGI